MWFSSKVPKTAAERETQRAQARFELVAGGKVFTSPKPDKTSGEVVQKHLGFVCDTNLSGRVHAQRAKTRARAVCQTVRL